MTGSVERVYSSALFDIGKETEKLDSIHKDLNECNKVFNENPDLQKLLLSPTISIQEKCDILSKIFAGAEEYVYNILCVITEHKRINFIDKITDDFNSMYDEYNDIADVKVTTTIPLTDMLKDKLIAKLSQNFGKTIRMSEAIDPKILGGIVIEYNGMLIDNSLKNKLSGISNELKKR